MVKKILLALPLFILLIIEWVLDMITQIVGIIHKGFKDLAIAVDIEYKTKKEIVEPDSGQK